MSTALSDLQFDAPEPHLDPAVVALIGAGPLARAVARILISSGTTVRLHARRPEGRRALEAEVPGLLGTDDLAEAVRNAGTLFVAVPAGELHEIAMQLGPHVLPDQIALLASRGVSEGCVFPHEHLRAHSCLRQIGVLGGPLHARELDVGHRVNVVIASRFSAVHRRVEALTRAAPVAYHPTRDVMGVEVAGAIANVASLAAGMAEGLGLGGTARGVLLARGVIESKLIGVALGASSETFTGLAGLGELIPRSVTSMDRHVEVGRLIATGLGPAAALEQVAAHVEGVTTAREMTKRARTLGLSLPLVSAVAAIFDDDAEVRERLEEILARPLPLDPGRT